MAMESQRDGELRYAEIAEITTEDEFNPRSRIDEEALAELTASVQAAGASYSLLAATATESCVSWRDTGGSRPPRAAGLKRVPMPVATDDDIRQDAITENLQRQDLRPGEEARAFERAQKQAGLSQKALAERLGKSPASCASTCGCCACRPGAGGGRRRPDSGLGG